MFAGRSREGGPRYPPSNFGKSISDVDRAPRVIDEIQKQQPGWGNLLGRSEGFGRERSREAEQNRQPFDLGRSMLQENRDSISSQQVQQPQRNRGSFMGRGETSITDRSESQQQATDLGRSLLEVGSGRPLWRRPNYSQRDGRGRPFPSQGQEQGQEDRPVVRRVELRDRPDQEFDQRGRNPFGSHQPQETQERVSASGGGAPLNSAQQFHQAREKPIKPIGNVDTGNRSGLDALLQHMGETKKSNSRFTRSTEELPRRGSAARNFAPYENRNTREGNHRGQMWGLSNTTDEIIPKLPTVGPEPFLDLDDDAARIRRERHKGRSQESGEEVPRTRGRFRADSEEPAIAAPKLVTQMERRGARRAFPRRNDSHLQDPDDEIPSAGRDRKKKKARAKSKEVIAARIPIQLPEFISVENLSTALRVRIDEFITRMEEMGFERPRHDHVLDAETSGLIAGEFNFEPVFSQEFQDLVPRPIPEDVSSLPQRPPIVTIMGHVDHGKTTILDWLRKSSVVESEHGGITQHIGAFSVTMPGGKQITFLDTPGHAAFLDMRRRGANVTDIVILVVAADDSVKPQTVEAIKHATDAKVPIIVAINKVDKEDSNVDRVKQDLARHGVTVEDFGGEVQAIPVSGKLGRGMAELEEATVTLSELLDHRAEIDGPAEGWIIESKVTTSGRVATVLIRRGTLRAGDIIVAGTTWARVRTLRNDNGTLVDSAPPGTPVQIDGWRGDDPIAGWQVLQANDEDHAKAVVEHRQEREEYTKLADDTTAINAIRAEEADARAKQLAWEAQQVWARRRASRRPKDNAGWVESSRNSGGPKEVLFVVKADVSGSVEALVNSISAIGNSEIAANVIRSGVGAVNESDVNHLASSGEVGYLVSFNQPVDAGVARLAGAEGLEILDCNVIYKVTDLVKEKLSAELPPSISQRVVGEAEVGKVFEISVKKGRLKVAGCMIGNGVVGRDKKVRVMRGGRVVYDGEDLIFLSSCSVYQANMIVLFRHAQLAQKCQEGC
jgi:small GTP-binding protein